MECRKSLHVVPAGTAAFISSSSSSARTTGADFIGAIFCAGSAGCTGAAGVGTSVSSATAASGAATGGGTAAGAGAAVVSTAECGPVEHP